MSPRPINKSVKRIVAKDNQLICRQTWTAPDALDADLILDGQLVAAAGQTTIVFAAQPDFARTLSLIAKTNATDVKAGDVVITGTDIDGNVISDSLTFTDNLATAINSIKAFLTVTSVKWPAQDGSTATWDLGTLDALGLDNRIDEDSVLHSLVDDTVETTRPTVVAHATDKTQCTVDCDTALDGAKDVTVYYAYPYPS